MNREANVLACYADRFLPFDEAWLSDEYFYQSVSLCVIDAVYSIGVRYTGVQAVVDRYCERFELRKVRENRTDLPPEDEQESISTFCKRLGQMSPEEMAVTVFKNRQRTSTRGGILKAEAVQMFAQVLRNHKLEYFQDVCRVAGDESLERSILAIPGQASGISLKYFWMLAGSEDFIKPDRMVLRFVESALGRSVSVSEAERLLLSACNCLMTKYPNLNPRLFDHEIWKYQRKNR